MTIIKWPPVEDEPPKRDSLQYKFDIEKDFSSKEEGIEFLIALVALQAGDKMPLANFLKKRNDAVSKVLGDILAGAILGDIFTPMSDEAFEATFKKAYEGRPPEDLIRDKRFKKPPEPALFTLDIVPQSRSEKYWPQYYTKLAIREMRYILENGGKIKKSDLKKSKRAEYGLETEAFEKAIAEDERKHGPLPRDPRGRKPKKA